MKHAEIVTIVAAMLAGASTSVLAQAAPAAKPAATGGLEEIVVTATKRNENLQVVPVAVSAISSAGTGLGER